MAGLVTGGDLMAQLRGKLLGQRLLIPQNMLRHGERVFLDDVSLDDVERELGVPSSLWPRTGMSCWTPCAGWRSLRRSRFSCGRRPNTFNIDRSDEIGDRSLRHGEISPIFYLLSPILKRGSDMMKPLVAIVGRPTWASPCCLISCADSGCPSWRTPPGSPGTGSMPHSRALRGF